jgi:hypothetical protein
MKAKSIAFLVLASLLATLVIAEQAMNTNKDHQALDSKFLQLSKKPQLAKDSVLKTLRLLVNDAIAKVKDLDHRWYVEVKRLQGLGTALVNILGTQGSTCSKADKQLQTMVDRLQVSLDTISTTKKRIHEINRMVMELSDQRCEANLIFIDRLRDNKLALHTIQIFRGWVKSAEQQSKNFDTNLIQTSNNSSAPPIEGLIQVMDGLASKGVLIPEHVAILAQITSEHLSRGKENSEISC